MSRYSDADKAEALEVLKADGLAAAARAVGCSKSTVIRWARAAGLDPADYADRSTTQNQQAARASVAARQAAMVDRRASLSDLILERITPRAAELLADRLDEEAEVAEQVKAAAERLELAIGFLDATAEEAKALDENATTRQRRFLEEQRRQARADVDDAQAILKAHRAGRLRVPDLVGVITRGIHDHLALEGEAAEVADAAGFTVVLSAPRPNRRNRPDPVVLDPEDTPTTPSR